MRKRCIVVGGGVAGMSAAIHCARAGMEVQLLEARPYLGGRAHSFDESTTQEHIDNGQHLMMGCYHGFLSFLTELGTVDQLQWQKVLTVHFRDAEGAHYVFAPKLFSGTLGAAESLIRLPMSLSAKWHAIQLMISLRLGVGAHTGESALEFLQRHGQHPQMITGFWEPLVVATLNAHPAQADATLLIEVLNRSILAGARESALLIARGGLSALFEPFESRLRSLGGSVSLRTEVEQLYVLDGKCHSLQTKHGTTIDADAFIVATPPTSLHRMLSQSLSLHTAAEFPVNPIAQFDHSPIVSIYMWFDRDFMEEDICAALGTTIQWIFNRRKLCDADGTQRERYPGHVTLTISAARTEAEMDSAALVAHCLQELHCLFPESRHATLLAHKTIKERQATILATPQANQHRPASTTGISNLFLAGDWTRTGLPATLEGAAQSGIEAANRVLLTQS